MKESVHDQLLNLSDNFIGYLPNLLGGILLVMIGWILGWLVKRLLIQLFVLLRVDRLLLTSRWKNDFTKGDVRHQSYRFIGNFGFIFIFLLFLNNAFIIWKLTMFSDLLSKGIYYLPKIIIALFIFGIGWLMAAWAAKSIMRTMIRENIPRPSLISRFVNGIILLFFSAMALVVLDIAKEIVIIGFATTIVTLGAIVVVIVATGGKRFIKKMEKSWREMRE